MRPVPFAHAPLALALVAAIAAFGAQAQVYKWKDARGVTHYSQTPPPKGKFSEQAIRKGPATTDQKPVTTTESSTCTSARRNVELLKASAPVQVDSDGDGKGDKTLADTDRANQLAYAEAALKANDCAPATTPQS